jgi:hypothetical protein
MGTAIVIAVWCLAVAGSPAVSPASGAGAAPATTAPSPPLTAAVAPPDPNPTAAGRVTVAVSGLPPGVEPAPQGVLRRSSAFGSAWIAALVGLGALVAALGATVRRRLAWIGGRPEPIRTVTAEATVDAGAAWETIAAPGQMRTTRTTP